jgi:DNA-binding MarR family transcriptional regulator
MEKYGPRRQAEADYEALACFRYALRKFLRASKEILRSANLTCDQFHALLTIKGFHDDGKVMIADLAERLQVRHHSTVELVNQLVSHGLIVRENATDDRRRIYLALARKGHDLVTRLAPVHADELRRLGPEMIDALKRITAAPAAPVVMRCRRAGKKPRAAWLRAGAIRRTGCRPASTGLWRGCTVRCWMPDVFSAVVAPFTGPLRLRRRSKSARAIRPGL